MEKKSKYAEVLSEYSYYSEKPEVQRVMAVIAALEILDSNAIGNEKMNIVGRLSRLGDCADEIQRALDKKKVN